MALEVQWEHKPVAFSAQQGTTLPFFLLFVHLPGVNRWGKRQRQRDRGRGVLVWRRSLAHAIIHMWKTEDTFR